MKTQRSRFQSAVAGITAFCMAFTQVAIAAPAFSTSAHEVSLPDTARLDQAIQINVPSSVATVDKWISGNDKTIFHIQSAHGQYQAEKQIERLLGHLEKNYGVDTLLLEGSSEALNPEVINFFPDDRQATLEAVDAFVRHAVISGPEVFLLNSEKAQGFGIEDETAYEQNLQDFVAVVQAREESSRFLDDLEQGVEALSAIYLSSDLRSFLKRVERKETSNVPFDIYLQQLKLAAEKHLKVDFSDASWQVLWPMLTRVFIIEKIEEKIDGPAFQKQKESFLKAIRPAVSKEIYDEVERLLNLKDLHARLPDPETSALFESLVQSLPDNFDYNRFSSVTAFCGLLMLKSQLKIDLLSEEIARVEDKIADSLTDTKEGRELVSILKDYRLLKKLFTLELIPTDFDRLSERPGRLVQRLSALNDDFRAKDIQFKNVEELELLYDKAVQFYEGARQRDHEMLARVEERLAETGADKVAIITGGFHSEPFASYFEKKGYSYALMTPRLTTVDVNGRQNYLDVMQAWAAAPSVQAYSSQFNIQQSTIPPELPTGTVRGPAFLMQWAPKILSSDAFSRLMKVWPFRSLRWNVGQTRSGAALPQTELLMGSAVRAESRGDQTTRRGFLERGAKLTAGLVVAGGALLSSTTDIFADTNVLRLSELTAEQRKELELARGILKKATPPVAKPLGNETLEQLKQILNKNEARLAQVEEKKKVFQKIKSDDWGPQLYAEIIQVVVDSSEDTEIRLEAVKLLVWFFKEKKYQMPTAVINHIFDEFVKLLDSKEESLVDPGVKRAVLSLIGNEMTPLLDSGRQTRAARLQTEKAVAVAVEQDSNLEKNQLEKLREAVKLLLASDKVLESIKVIDEILSNPETAPEVRDEIFEKVFIAFSAGLPKSYEGKQGHTIYIINLLPRTFQKYLVHEKDQEKIRLLQMTFNNYKRNIYEKLEQKLRDSALNITTETDKKISEALSRSEARSEVRYIDPVEGSLWRNLSAEVLGVERKFGTNGIRGTGFNVEELQRMTAASALELKAEWEAAHPGEPLPYIGIASDPRPQGEQGFEEDLEQKQLYTRAMAEVLAAFGFKVRFYNEPVGSGHMIATTSDDYPESHRNFAVLMGTASHNEVRDTVTGELQFGLKVFKSNAPIMDDLAGRISDHINGNQGKSISQITEVPVFGFVQAVASGAVEIIDSPADFEVARLAEIFDAADIGEKLRQKFPQFRYALNVMHGGMGKLAPQIASALGFSADQLQAFNMLFMNNPAVREKVMGKVDAGDGKMVDFAPDPTRSAFWGEEYKAFVAEDPENTVALLIDGDADRLVLELDGEISPNQMGPILKYALRKYFGVTESLRDARTVPTTSAMDLLNQALEVDAPIVTDVGSKNFVPFLGDIEIGLEESGHIAFRYKGQVFFDHPAALMLMMLKVMAETGKTWRELEDEMWGFITEKTGAPRIDTFKTGLSKADGAETYYDLLAQLPTDETARKRFGEIVTEELAAEGIEAKLAGFDTTAPGGVQFQFEGYRRTMPRKSGTDGSVRFYFEAPVDQVEKLKRVGTKVMKKALDRMLQGASSIKSKSTTDFDQMRKELEKFIAPLGLDQTDVEYFLAMLYQHRVAERAKALGVKSSQKKIGETFWPSAMLTSDQTQDHLNEIQYPDLVKQVQALAQPPKVAVRFNSLDGGLGTTVDRFRSNLLEAIERLELDAKQSFEINITQGESQTSVTVKGSARDILMAMVGAIDSHNKAGGAKFDKDARIDFQVKAADSQVVIASSFVQIGAKGTDLPFDIVVNGKKMRVTVAEIKAHRMYQDGKRYESANFRPLVNEDSAPSYVAFLDQLYFYDVAMGVEKPRTYRELLSEDNLSVAEQDEFVMQKKLPNIRIDEGAGQYEGEKPGDLTIERTAPANHGQLGFGIVVKDILDNADEIIATSQRTGVDRIEVFQNGDNVSSTISPEIAHYMAANDIPMVIVSTDKAPVDMKGGQIGIEAKVNADGTLEGVTINKDGTITIAPGAPIKVTIMEKAEASTSGDLAKFFPMGIDGKFGLPGRKQSFNTNVIAFNATVLAKLLKQLEAVLGRNELLKLISPDNISEEKKKIDQPFFQLGGAISSLVFNLNSIFTLANPATPQGKAIRAIHDGSILKLVNLSAADRSRFFAPIKTSVDYALLNYMNFYEYVEEGRLEITEEARSSELPQFTLGEEDEDGNKTADGKKTEGFYKDTLNAKDAFIGVTPVNLNLTIVKGYVLMPGSRLEDDIIISSDYPAAFNLSESDSPALAPYRVNGRLELKDVRITIDEKGNLTVESLVAKPAETVAAERAPSSEFSVNRLELGRAYLSAINLNMVGDEGYVDDQPMGRIVPDKLSDYKIARKDNPETGELDIVLTFTYVTSEGYVRNEDGSMRLKREKSQVDLELSAAQFGLLASYVSLRSEARFFDMQTLGNPESVNIPGMQNVYRVTASNQGLKDFLNANMPKGTTGLPLGYAAALSSGDSVTVYYTGSGQILWMTSDAVAVQFSNTNPALAQQFNPQGRSVAVVKSGPALYGIIAGSTGFLKVSVIAGGVGPNKEVVAGWGIYPPQYSPTQEDVPSSFAVDPLQVVEGRDGFQSIDFSMVQIASSLVPAGEDDSTLSWINTEAGIVWNFLRAQLPQDQFDALNGQLTSLIEADPEAGEILFLPERLRFIINPQNEVVGLAIVGQDGSFRPIASFLAQDLPQILFSEGVLPFENISAVLNNGRISFNTVDPFAISDEDSQRGTVLRFSGVSGTVDFPEIAYENAAGYELLTVPTPEDNLPAFQGLLKQLTVQLRAAQDQLAQPSSGASSDSFKTGRDIELAITSLQELGRFAINNDAKVIAVFGPGNRLVALVPQEFGGDRDRPIIFGNADGEALQQVFSDSFREQALYAPLEADLFLSTTAGLGEGVYEIESQTRSENRFVAADGQLLSKSLPEALSDLVERFTTSEFGLGGAFQSTSFTVTVSTSASDAQKGSFSFTVPDRSGVSVKNLGSAILNASEYSQSGIIPAGIATVDELPQGLITAIQISPITPVSRRNDAGSLLAPVLPVVRSESRLTLEDAIVILENFTFGIITDRREVELAVLQGDESVLLQAAETVLKRKIILSQDDGAGSYLDQILDLADQARIGFGAGFAVFNQAPVAQATQGSAKPVLMAASAFLHLAQKNAPAALALVERLSAEIKAGNTDAKVILAVGGLDKVKIFDLLVGLLSNRKSGFSGNVADIKGLLAQVLSLRDEAELAQFISQADGQFSKLDLGIDSNLLGDIQVGYAVELMNGDRVLEGKDLWAVAAVGALLPQAVASVEGLGAGEAAEKLLEFFNGRQNMGLQYQGGVFRFSAVQTLIEAMLAMQIIEVMA